MLANDILRSIRYTLDLSDKRVVAIAETGGQTISLEQLSQYWLKEDDEGHEPCPDLVLAAFLNGLITDRRGSRGPQAQPEKKLDNNLVLKKLRIAFSLHENEIESLVRASGSTLSRSELKAFFQKPEHKNFKPCGDQLLRHFLSGLTRNYRETDSFPDSRLDSRLDSPQDNPLYGKKHVKKKKN